MASSKSSLHNLRLNKMESPSSVALSSHAGNHRHEQRDELEGEGHRQPQDLQPPGRCALVVGDDAWGRHGPFPNDATT